MIATRKLFRFLKPYWKWATIGPLFMVLEVGLDLMQPRLMQHIIDEGIGRGDLVLVQRTGLWMLLLALCGVFAGMGCTVFSTKAAQGFGADLRRALFGKVQTLSFGNLDELESGALITRLTNDVTQVQDTVMMMMRVMVRVPLLLVGSLIMAIFTSPRLALLFVPLMPFVALVLWWIINKTYPLFGQVQSRLDTLNTILQENLSGVRVVKAYARENFEEARFGSGNRDLVAINIVVARLGAVTMPLMMIALNVGIVAALWLGGVQVSRWKMEVGQIIAFVNYLSQTLMALMMISMLIVRLSRAEASAIRIEDVMKSVPKIADAPRSSTQTSSTRNATKSALRGQIEFQNVCFAYNGENCDDAVLRDISFVAPAGKTTAILGATGSGKSSLVQLIPRFYDAIEGRVLVDNIDVRDFDEGVLRNEIGIALQESVLFSGTIRDNIAYGRPNASDEEILAASRAAQADDFIQNLPDGYQTAVGQRGVNLSGGQKQRLAIARALLLHTPILILDDSTSAVDVRTESKIQHALANEYSKQTRLIVAQRISTVVNADQILVLDDGHLAAHGTHEELLRDSPIYREIYESQVEQNALEPIKATAKSAQNLDSSTRSSAANSTNASTTNAPANLDNEVISHGQ